MPRLGRSFPNNHHHFAPPIINPSVAGSGNNASSGTGSMLVVTAPSRKRPWRGARSEAYFMELVDRKGGHVGLLNPVFPARIDGVTDAPVARKLSNILLAPGDWEDIDFDQARLKPWMLTDNAAEPLGVFMRVTKEKHRSTSGTYLSLQCQDLGFGLQSTFGQSANVVTGDVVATRIAQYLNEVNVYDKVLAQSGITSTAFLGAPIGSPRWNFIAFLCKLAGLTSPWYDRFGVAHVSRIPYAGYTKPLRRYNPGELSLIIDDTGTETDELWNVPTGWVVVGKSDKGVQYAGRHDLPDSHPMSSASRDGFVNIKVVEMAGISSQDEADARARDQAQLDTKVNATRSYEALPDPTLEPWSILTHLGDDLLLDSWSHELVSGGHQQIKVRESVLT
jgi:hypothetical protein